MNRRRIVGLVAASVLAFSATSCSGGDEPQPGPSGSADTTGTISFMTWTTGAQVDKATKETAALYERTHPGVKVNVTILPYDQYAQKIQLLAASGSLPDVFQAGGSALKFVQSDRVLRLEDYISKDPVLSDPAQTRTAAFDAAKIDGEHIDAFPLGALCGMQLYYNRDLFDKANVEYPTDSWTWNDFREAAKKLTIAQGDRTVQWGADLGYTLGWDGGWQTIAASNGMANPLLQTVDGKPHLALDQQPVVDAWQFMQDLVYTDKVAPNPATVKALSQSGGTAFQSGRVAMVPDGCWQMGNYKVSVKNLGIARLPGGTTGKSIGPIWPTNMFIAKTSKHPQLAFDFLRWWTVDKAAFEPYANASGWCGAPVVKSFDSVLAEAWKDIPGGDACMTSLDDAMPFTIITPNWEQASTNVLNPLWNDQFLQNKINAQQLSEELMAKLNPAL